MRVSEDGGEGGWNQRREPSLAGEGAHHCCSPP